MNNCKCASKECNGTVERFSIYSPDSNTTYPNRFWGVTDYCEYHKEDDEKQGFILHVTNEEKVYVL